jgi:hypothetical protein
MTPLYWRCRYNVAVHRANRILTGGVPTVGSLARVELYAQGLQLGTLISALDRAAEYKHLPEADRHLAKRLADLARPAVTGLTALDGRAATKVRRELAGYDSSASQRGMVNIANGYALLYSRNQGRGEAADLGAAVGLMRLAGLEVGGRADIVADPVLSLLKGSEPYLALLRDWGLATAPFAALDCIGADRAKKLEADYPTATQLRSALHREPDKVFARAEVGAENRAWWTGALDWLIAGRDAATINAYQAAGIRTAREAARLGDDAVVDLLHRRGMDDKAGTVPDARCRALMEGTAGPGRTHPPWWRWGEGAAARSGGSV